MCINLHLVCIGAAHVLNLFQIWTILVLVL